MIRDRRRLLQGLAAVGGVALLPPFAVASGAAPSTQPLPEFPFRLGVASGYPDEDTVVLWTRLAPDPTRPDGGLPPIDWQVRYEVALDDRFRRIVARGETVAVAAHAHSARVQVRGLAPARDYWYRFTAAGHSSPAGRTRTLPRARARVAALHLAVASCQHYEHGHFAAWRHVAAAVPDLVVHVGDYIYEGAPTANRVRRHVGPACRTLDDYRQRYAQYLCDPSLQSAHAAAPWLLTWDDHEVANDYSGARDGRSDESPAFLVRRAAAYQAWYEHLPVPPSMAPRADGGIAIHTRHRIGRLASLNLLDQRQYRSPQACPVPGRFGGNRLGDACTERLEAARTMLGAAQEQWLEQGLAQHPARWTLLAQGTVFSQLDELPGEPGQYWSDGWTGYPAARQRVIDTLQRTRSTNPVVLSGDLHAFVVAGVRAVPERAESPLVAAEFVTTSISSDSRPQSSLDEWRDNNPHIQLMDGRQRGFLAVRISEERMQVDLVAVDDVNRPDAGRQVMRRFAVEAGDPAIVPA